jgi:hypothetical protein
MYKQINQTYNDTLVPFNQEQLTVRHHRGPSFLVFCRPVL